MGESVCHAARELSLPPEVMRNFFRLIKSVKEAVDDEKLTLIVAPRVNQAELLDSLIDEYSRKL